jgi:hypothetical protein
VPFAFLPDGFRQVAPWLPNGAIVSAARDTVYFPASSLRHPLLVLGIWLAGSLAMLACVDLLHVAERRRAPQQRAEVYATPAAVHLRRRLALRRAAALDAPRHHSPAVSSITISAADCGCLMSPTLCPAHIDSASMSPVVPTIGGAPS